MNDIRVLIVDDSASVRRVMSEILHAPPEIEVIGTAPDPFAAARRIQESVPDVLVLDIEMPRMDGYQFATHVRNDPKVKHLPIIMITSRSGEKHRAKAIEIGVNDYLSKPYQESQLIAAITALLGREL